ncbi:MAG: PAS domain-containing protein [Betaproteobacteria bacterium]|nr:PAS domain-containing protein [Betaproteobacteria bacterium]
MGKPSNKTPPHPGHPRPPGLPVHRPRPESLKAVGEDVWIDVIRKMDEVYNDLLQYEVALEDKNRALEESQQFIYSVLTSMSDVLLVCDRDGRVQEVNRALLDLTGKAEQELVGTPVAKLFAGEESQLQVASFMARLYNEPIHDCELNFRGRDGSPLPVSLNCTPRYDQKGRLLGMVLVGRPVGELRRAYSALRQAHDDLKRTQQQLLHSEKMASLGLLVAGVAHELNNPISFVLGNVHALKRYTLRLGEYLAAIHQGAGQEHLDQLRRSLRIDRLMADLAPLIDGTVEGAERTRDIVAGLKRFSAADRDAATVFNLREILERSAHWVVKATGSRMRIEWDLPEALPVLGSEGQIQQVIVNLVQNAVDSAGSTPEPRLEIRARARDGKAEVSFRDNGPGIDDKHLKQIFDPFFTTKPVGKGTGLGLSISYGIVERHGGSLAAANHPGGGAVFDLRLPLARTAADGQVP